MAQFDPNDPAIYAQLFGQAPPQGTSFVPPQVPQAPIAPTDPYAAMALGVEADRVGPQPENAMWTPDTPQEEATTAEWRPSMEKPVYTEMGAGPQGRGQSQSRSVSTSSSTPGIIQKELGPQAQAGDPASRTAARAAGLNEATQGRIDANSEVAEAEGAVIRKEAEGVEAMSEFDAIAAEEMAFNDQAANEAAQQRIQGIQNAADAVAAMKVDPSQLWGEKGSMQNVAGIAAAFMGGFLQPVLGTNTAQQIIDSSIERNINAQRSNIQNAQQNVSNLKMLHSLGLDQASTESEQRAQQRILMRAGLAGQFQAEALKLQDPVLQKKYGALSADLIAQNAKDIDAIGAQEREITRNQMNINTQNKLASQRVAISRQAERRAASDSEYARARQEKMDAAAGAAADQVGAIADPLTGEVRGRYRKPDDKAAQEKYERRLAGRANTVRDLEELKKDITEAGFTFYGGKGRDFLRSAKGKEYMSRYQTIFNNYRREMTGAAGSAKESDEFRVALPEPETLLTSDPGKAWRSFNSTVANHQFRDNNQSLLDNQWDPRKEWINPDPVAKRERSIGSQVEVLKQQAQEDPAKALITASEIVNRASTLELPPGDSRLQEAANILSGIPREQRTQLKDVNGTLTEVDPLTSLLQLEREGSAENTKRDKERAQKERLRDQARMRGLIK